MSQSYNPANWYWLADDGRLFSSSRAALVSETDAAFKSWSAGGLAPQRWPQDEAGAQTDGALQDVLTPYGLTGPGTTLTQLAARLIAAASAATGAIAAQIVPDRTHELAYLNAAALVGPGAVVPTEDPGKTAFAALANANGYGGKLQDFATLVAGISAASMSLSALLAGLTGSAAQAKSASDLKAALDAFEDGLSALLAMINGAGLTVSVAAPPAISIPGING